MLKSSRYYFPGEYYYDLYLCNYGSLAATLIFDMIYSKIELEREIEKSWQALNDQLEREGKPRWDQ
jgi:hypothetical protein